MNKSTNAQDVLELYRHHNLHTELLLKQYPDLKVIIDGVSISYYSTSINFEVDKFDLNKEYVTTYVAAYTISPYKEVAVVCSQCEGKIKVSSTPSRIPLVMEHETAFSKEYIWYGLVYEEQLKLNNFSTATLAKAQMFLIEELQKRTTPTSKVDISYLNNGIKRLLPFT